MYYQIVRIEEQGPDRDTFGLLDRWIRRGWTHKALAYMANWDYGEETADVAKHLGNVWRTPTDERERTDYVIRDENGYTLRRCAEAHRVSCDLSRSILRIRSSSNPVASDVLGITEAFYGEKNLFVTVDRHFDQIYIDYGLGHMLPKVDIQKLSLSLPFGTTI